MASLPADFREGAREIAPVLLMVVPYGVVVGATAVAAGFSSIQAIAFSGLANAGAAQLAAIDLLAGGAPLAVVVATALVINVRMLMYGASLAPYFRAEPLPWRGTLAHFIVDPTYALAVIAYESREAIHRRWYFLGLGVPPLLAWIAGTAIGAVVGARIPPWLPVSFAVPMVFLALLVQAVRDRASGAAAIAGGLLAAVGTGLPFNLGLLVGTVVGVGVGLVVEWLDGSGVGGDEP